MGEDEQKWAQKVEEERQALSLDSEVPSSEITEVLKTYGIASRSGRGGR